MLHEVKSHAAQFDILHFHTEMLHMPMFEKHAPKCVTTVHGRLDMADLPAAYGCWPAFGLVSISNSQRRPLPAANWIATVAHGLPIERYSFQPHPGGNYLAFLGRASPEKGLDTAINIARRAGLPLKIAAKIEPADRRYFEDVIEPMLQPSSGEYIGEITEDQKPGFLGNALALLFPIRWPEPFGLVMIEAMACGTPVIAFNRGAVPEIVEHGVSGFIVDSEDEALQAIGHLHELGRRSIRAIVDERFTAQTMARGYLNTYSRMSESQRCELAS
jgi:glycosyltransferase involved in cell wall biosynthesis